MDFIPGSDLIAEQLKSAINFNGDGTMKMQLSYSSIRKGFTDAIIGKVAEKVGGVARSNPAKKEADRLVDVTRKKRNSLAKSKSRLKTKSKELAAAKAAENTFKPILEAASNVTTFATNNTPVKVASDQIINYVEDKVHQQLGGDNNNTIVIPAPLVVPVEQEMSESGTITAYVVRSKRYVLQGSGDFAGQFVLEKEKKDSTKEEE